jgi:hypothetical protein
VRAGSQGRPTRLYSPARHLRHSCHSATHLGLSIRTKRRVARINYISPYRLRTGAGDETRTRDINLGKVALYQLSYTRIREGTRVISGREMSIHDSRQSLVRASQGNFAPRGGVRNRWLPRTPAFPCCGCFVEAARVNKSVVYLFSFITAKLVQEPDEIVEARSGPQGRRIHFLLAGVMGGISSRSADAPQSRRRAALRSSSSLTGHRFYPLTKAVRRWQIDWILFGGYNLPR